MRIHRALAATASTLVLSLLPALDAHAATLAHFDYGCNAKHFCTTKDFTSKGTYREINVVEVATVDAADYTCRPFTIQLFRAGTGHQVGSTRSFGCPLTRHPSTHFTGLPKGTYFVLHTAKPRKGHTYLMAGSVVYGKS
jgi:hypothetical protein